MGQYEDEENAKKYEFLKSKAAQDVKVAFKGVGVRDLKPKWFSMMLQASVTCTYPSVCALLYIQDGGFWQILLKKCKEYKWDKDYGANYIIFLTTEVSCLLNGFYVNKYL